MIFVMSIVVTGQKQCYYLEPMNSNITVNKDGENLEFYLAPLEGITGCVFRQCLHRHFGEGITKYFTPFLVPHEKKPMSSKEIKEILPENNGGFSLVPQILSNDAGDFVLLAKELGKYGYEEVNLNLGCPSRTVVNKGRGSGFLRYPCELDEFLYEIFANAETRISVKTRLGDVDSEEFFELLEIFNKYPIDELIIHPRVRASYYLGNVDTETFFEALPKSLNPVCYNGDIFSKTDLEELLKWDRDSLIKGVMIGRGVLRNPSLFREINGGKPASVNEIREFLRDLQDSYSAVFSGETPVLQKMKEIWSYLAVSFPEYNKECKEILKCRSLKELRMLTMRILSLPALPAKQ